VIQTLRLLFVNMTLARLRLCLYLLLLLSVIRTIELIIMDTILKVFPLKTLVLLLRAVVWSMILSSSLSSS